MRPDVKNALGEDHTNARKKASSTKFSGRVSYRKGDFHGKKAVGVAKKKSLKG